MNCNVIQDLMILYTDDCCSEESRAIVEEHIKTCTECEKTLTEIYATQIADKKISQPVSIGLTKINVWKASVLQSVLLFISFAVLVAGVKFEAETPLGSTNGLWAISIIVPITGFFLSLANWYFVRLYSSKKSFSNCSLIATFLFIIIGYIWVLFHYGKDLLNVFNGKVISTVLFVVGTILFIILCIISKLLSLKYAEMIGKE